MKPDLDAPSGKDSKTFLDNFRIPNYESLKSNTPIPKRGAIIIVDDDFDDQEIIELAIRDLGISNEIVFLNDGDEGLEYLRTTQDIPFLILSDINMPRINGIEFKKEIDLDPNLKSKNIPFIFYTTSVSKVPLIKAYSEMTVQGYFQKAYSYQELKSTIKKIIEYWFDSKHPLE